MSEVKHTPGPWVIKHGNGKATISGTDGHGAISTVRMRESKTNNIDELVGNIALIASAPELLAACVELLNCIDPARDWFEARRARAAIAKATGRA